MFLQSSAFGHFWVCWETADDNSPNLLVRWCFSYCCEVQIPPHYIHCRKCRNKHFCKPAGDNCWWNVSLCFTDVCLKSVCMMVRRWELKMKRINKLISNILTEHLCDFCFKRAELDLCVCFCVSAVGPGTWGQSLHPYFTDWVLHWW